MSILTPDLIENYINSLYRQDEQLIRMRAEAERLLVPIVTRDMERLLTTLCSLRRPKTILEIGTAIGYSALCFAKAAPEAHIIVGNPVVLSSSTYTYFADGLKRIDSITNDDKGMVTSDAVYKKTKDLPQVATTSGVNLFQIKSIAANSSNVSINGYHFVSGIMFITINGLGTVILKYAAQATNIVVFDILTTPNVLTASIVNYQGLLKYNGNTILKLYRTSDSDIKIDNVNAIVIRTDYCSL